MKKLGLLAAACVMSSASFAAPVNGGTVHFVGELVNAACAVSTDTADQTVDLGQHRTARLAVAGDKSGPVPFNIQLVDCDASLVTKGVSFAFNGQTVNNNKLLLAVNGGGGNAPAATNVGIEITDYASKILAVDGSDFSTEKAIIDGTNTFPFTARYVATGASTPGKANADATFVVNYN
ncbi:type 1 fimbrial major subunit FimA [Acinetobacter bereziniae]|uniref:type 1 fimbrial major subunit FimA n=1 Tax=Acinetobacter bereziniae TaxID=106648 RepID=UPI00124F7F29|nr:type 1 fimbrial major subunit FimA [Acinetobacter bereziniae]MBJ8552977.1 type 1 fimbrial major subunit FimA [Acinetobacter bereziniae]MCU4418517.1 type 1 fimbrial major subunit FimA [Acinetobacter bereziniae]MCU4433958.1 type 1 fimbrial major subunit FimA [Acinetobacter bereziniae]MCV2441981.1 type 1 fimbrial major subunit FimA [Acinetobacter bereziniae]MDR6542556.1 major type 1 subunit fimbrin (pilin) [Acinetobacter bereziniae]